MKYQISSLNSLPTCHRGLLPNLTDSAAIAPAAGVLFPSPPAGNPLRGRACPPSFQVWRDDVDHEWIDQTTNDLLPVVNAIKLLWTWLLGEGQVRLAPEKSV